MSLAIFVLAHVAFALAAAAVAGALGRRVLALVGPAPSDDRWGLALAVGIGAIGCGASLLGVLGLLTRPWLALLVAAAVVLAAPEWWRILMAPRPSPARPWLPVACILLASLPALLLALYPPTGFDALLYHFPAAARFAASGRITVAPELRFPAFPWLNEVLFAVAMRLYDDVAAQCLQWVVHVATALLLWEGCRKRFGPAAGALAAALWLGDPLAGWLAASAYVEPLVALFMLATLEALDTGERAPAPRALLVAGALAGCAAATKYQGLLAIVLVGAWTFFGAPQGRRWRSALPPLLVAAAIALPWTIWITWATGDPLFPLLTRLHHPQPTGLDVPGLSLRLLRLPWATIKRILWPYPPGSPFVWLLWPLPLLGWRRAPRAGRLAGVAVACGIVIAAAARDPRLVSVVEPWLCAAIAAVLATWASARWRDAVVARRRLALGLLVALAPAWCYAAVAIAHRGALPSTDVARDAYLERQLPGYRALSWIRSTQGERPAVYGLWAENLRYYAPGRFFGDWYGPVRFADVAARLDRPAELHALLSGLGVEHLLVLRLPRAREPAVAARGDAFLALEYRDDEATVWALAPRDAAAAPAEGR